MEEIMKFLMDTVIQLVVWPYLITFMFMAYLVKKQTQHLLVLLTSIKWKLVYTVLLLATIIAVPFVMFTDYGWEKILVTYAVGTSLHELFFEIIEKKVKR